MGPKWMLKLQSDMGWPPFFQFNFNISGSEMCRGDHQNVSSLQWATQVAAKWMLNLQLDIGWPPLFQLNFNISGSGILKFEAGGTTEMFPVCNGQLMGGASGC